MNEFLLLMGACLLGFLFGIITGLTPGIHVNTLLPLIAALPISELQGAVGVFSLAITHTFLDFIPSSIFGIPDEDTALSILPAHQLLLAGKGYEAIKLTVVGSLGAFIISLFLVLPLISIIPMVYRVSYSYMGYILLFLVFVLIISEKSPKKIISASMVFLLSSMYGYILLSSPLLCEDGVLFPIFSGLFGISTLSVSMRNQSKVPFQSLDSKIHLKHYEVLTNILKGGIAGILVSLLPGIGPAHATTIISVQTSPRKFLVAVSGVNTANAVYALLVLYTVQKCRSGAVIAIEKLIHIDSLSLIILLICGLIAAGASSVAALCLARIFLKALPSLNYRGLMVSTCGILVIVVWIITGVTGLLVMVVGSCIGILPVFLGVRRSHCMGVLLFPVIHYYL
ncbi:MAG: tripartite tricarboxylate transporter permease [Theionarchaea archaeon]|nr:tripartite tricarboxylate transporter permease [Theionarchaea archaeon]